MKEKGFGDPARVPQGSVIQVASQVPLGLFTAPPQGSSNPNWSYEKLGKSQKRPIPALTTMRPSPFGSQASPKRGLHLLSAFGESLLLSGPPGSPGKR